MSLPAPLPITIYRGNTFSLLLEIHVRNADETIGAAVDLTGYTWLSQIRASATSNTVVATFAVTPAADQVANRGQVTLSFTHTVTKDLPPTPNTPYSWDLQFVDGSGRYDTPVGGPVTIVADTSRDD